MYVYMSVLRYVYASVVPTEVRGNDPPELELQIVVSLPIFWELPTCMGSSARAESLAISPAPVPPGF